MQRERHRAVKTSPTARRGFSKALGRTRQLGLRAPRKPGLRAYKNNENRDCTRETTDPVFRISRLINRLGINFRDRAGPRNNEIGSAYQPNLHSPQGAGNKGKRCVFGLPAGLLASGGRARLTAKGCTANGAKSTAARFANLATRGSLVYCVLAASGRSTHRDAAVAQW
jgi:hypothetical protein